MALSSSFANHLAPGLMDIVGLRFKNYPAWYSQLLNVMTSERQYEDFLNATGLPIAVARAEGEPVPFYDPLEGLTKRFTHGNFSIGFQVSREAWNDDMYKSKSALRKAANGLVRSCTEKVEIDAAFANFNDGFSGNTKSIDNVTLYSASHTRLDGSGITQSNLQASAAITLTTLRQAQLLFYGWTDDRGIKIICNPTTLVTSNYDATAYTAAALLQSPMSPDTTNLVKNVTQGFLTQVKYPYLTDANSYFILGDEHQLNFIWRERPTLDSWDDKNTRTAKFASYMRYSTGPVHWVGAVGCQGG